MNLLISSRKFDGVVGGVEKMVLLLGQQMQLRGHTVTVLSLDNADAQSFNDWPEGVSWVKIGIGDVDSRATFKVRVLRAIEIRKVLRDRAVDTCVGFQIGTFALLRFASLGLGLRCVAAERNAPTLFNYIKRGQIKRIFSNLILTSATAISVQLEENRNHYPSWLQEKITINNNPVILPSETRVKATRVESGQVILYIGRITFQKNLEVLIEALAQLSTPPLLRIVGGGDALPSVISLANTMGVELEKLDFSNNLEEFYLGADLFCLPSRWEGFPNVVGEALAHGLPVVGFQECAGISTLVDNGITGIIAPGNDNPYALASALKTALETDWNPEIIRNSMKKYSIENFTDSWENTLFQLDKHG